MKIISLLFVLGAAIAANAQPIETVVQRGHELAVLSIVTSPDSGFVVSTSRDKSAKLWDLNTGREVRSFLGHEASVTTASFSPDGKYLLTGSNDQTIRIWDVSSGRELFSKTTRRYVTDVVVDPRGRFFAYAGYDDSGYGDTAIVVDWKSKSILARIPVAPDKGLGRGVRLAVSNDGKWLATGEDNQQAKLYRTEDWSLVQTYEKQEGYCGGCGTLVTFSPDSKSLFVASHHGVLSKINLDDLILKQINSDEQDEPQGLVVSSDGSKVAVSCERKLSVYDVNGALLGNFEAPEKRKLHRVAFTPENDVLLVACDDNTIIRWELATKRETKPLAGILSSRDKGGLDYDPNSYWESYIAKYVRLKNPILIAKDGKSMIKGKFGTKVRHSDIATGRTYMEFAGHKKAVLAYDLTKDGKYLVTGGGDGKIILWNTATGDSIKVINSYREPIFDIHFSADETRILSSSWDASMKIHDLESGKMTSYFDLKNYSAFSVAFHPNDLYVVAAQLNNTLQMWEVDTRTVVRTFVGHSDVVSSLLFTNDRKTLVTASWDGTVRFWDISSGLMTAKITHSSAPVHALLFSNDQKQIFSAGADRLIKVWDVSSRKLVRTLAGHSAEITSLALSSDGKVLISHSVDGVTKFWNLDNNAEFFEHIHIGEKDWLVKNKDGYFTGTDGARQFVHFVKGTKTYNVDQFFHDFYKPELLPKIFQNRGVDSSKGIDNKLKSSPPPTVKVALLPSREGVAEVHVRMIDEGAGVQNLKLLHNGKSLALDKKVLRYPAGKDKFTTYSQEVMLVHGMNSFTASASNNDRVESEARSVEFFSESGVKNSRCFILSVGINEYKNPKMNLNYAKPDAISFGSVVDERSLPLFLEVKVSTLFDKDASKINILKMLDDLAGVIEPQDVFIFYYAGHGSMVDNKFYFIPTENQRLYDETTLKNNAIEASLIQEKLRNIKALKQLIVMDACQSGGSVELLAARGANEEKAIAQLSRSTGVHVMASAGSEQFAAEFGELGHGLFTYVLLRGLQGEADGSPRDGKVTIYELKSYIDDQVPELTRKLKGKPQYPYTFSRGQDFPVVLKESAE